MIRKENRMSNFKHLLIHEMRHHIHSMKFMTMSVFAVLLAVLCVTVQIADFQDRKSVYDEEAVKAENAVREAKVYSQVRVPVVVEPNPLSVFIRGAESEIGNKITVSPIDVPEFENTTQTKNAFLNIFQSFDLITLILTLFSVMTLFLVADTIAGEREEGTLRLIFSNSVFKSQYFLAKFLGSLIIIALPLILIFLIATIMIVMQPFMTLTLLHWGMIFLLLLCALAFVSVYIFIGLLISFKSASSSIAVLYGLILWIGIVFVYPNMTSYLVNSIVRIPSSDLIAQQINQMRQDISNRTEEATKHLEDRGSYNWYSGGEFGLPMIIGLTQKRYFDNHADRIRIMIPIVLNGIDGILRTEDAYKDQFIRQRRTAGILTRLLPGTLLRESTSKIAGTHYLSRDVQLLTQVKQYRADLIAYLRSKDAFGLKFFTKTQEEDMRDTWDEYTEELQTRCHPDNWKPLDLSDIPVFRLQRRPLIPPESLIDLILLVLLNAILFIIGGHVFSRSEIRKME